MALRFGLQGLGAVAILLWTSWKLAAVMLAVVPVVALGAVRYGRRLRRLSRRVQDALAGASEVAEESIAGIRTVRAFDREQMVTARYGDAVGASYELARQRAWIGGLFAGFIGVVGYGPIAAVLWYGGTLLIDGQLSFGQLTSFLLYTLRSPLASARSVGSGPTSPRRRRQSASVRAHRRSPDRDDERRASGGAQRRRCARTR